jgi:hypothetical protein
VYIEGIAIMLLDLMADENFRQEKLIELHASIMATGASSATPLASGQEQTTPLTSNVSAPPQQNLLSIQEEPPAPVNLDPKFEAANSPDESKVDTEDNEVVFIDGPHKSPVAPNRSLSKYSLSDAWSSNNLISSHSKFTGSSTSWHNFLTPELHCKQCSFPHETTIIFI